jgi:hypothetical protein
MEMSLVVRSHKLQYEPLLEELRLQHLTTHLQPFLALPLRMKGVSGLSERAGFFGAIAHAYPAATAKVCWACLLRQVWGMVSRVQWVQCLPFLATAAGFARHGNRTQLLKQPTCLACPVMC